MQAHYNVTLDDLRLDRHIAAILTRQAKYDGDGGDREYWISVE